MRTPSLCIALLAVSALFGCSGSKTPTADVTAPTGSETFDPAGTALPGGDMPALTGIAPLGLYRIEVNRDSLSGTASLHRAGAETDDLYFLSVDEFLLPESLKIDTVSTSPTTLNIDYTFTHPFAGPIDLDGPISATNRADLGISARILFLLDLPDGASPADYTFFGGEAVANVDAVRNADGFYRPEGLLPSATGLSADTFPYKLVIDETLGAEGNRVEVGNGGNPAGNFDAPNGGWQRGNITHLGVNNGWTGFDYLHQGQSGTNRLQIDLAYLASNTFRFDAAVIAKYQDPRGGTNSGEKRANRLPAVDPDTSKFVYRLPFSAIDCSKVGYRGESGGLMANDNASSTTVRFHVRDWDASASPSLLTDLALEPDPSLVLAGTQGQPTVSVDIPGYTAGPVGLAITDDDTAYGGDAGPDSGFGTDEIFFEGVVGNAVASGQTNGLAGGLMRVEDVENSLDRSEYEFNLAPDLTLLTADLPELVSYQSFLVNVGGVVVNQPPTADVVLAQGANPLLQSGAALDFLLTDELDPEGNPVLYSIDLTNDGSFELAGYDPAGIPPPDVTLLATFCEVNTSGGTLQRTARVEYADAAHVATPGVILLDYQVLDLAQNNPPLAAVSLVSTSIADGGVLEFQLDNELDPEGDTVTYDIMYDFSGTFVPDVVGANPPPPVSVLDISGPQDNTSGFPEPRTARVDYSDGVNPPASILLPYVLDFDPCGVESLSFDFNGSQQDWLKGTSYGPAPLQNRDISAPDGWGHFSHGCHATASEAASGGAINGEYWMTGDDFDDSSCDNFGDYGNQAAYNMLSPFITVPALCAAGSFQLVFDGIMTAAPSGQVRLYISTDNGFTWGAPVWTHNGTGAEELMLDTNIPIPDSFTDRDIMVRFEFVDNGGAFTVPGGMDPELDNAGIVIDNVRFTAGALDPFLVTVPSFNCQLQTMTHDFEINHDWVGGQFLTGAPLPNQDDLGFLGTLGSFRWTNINGSNDYSGTTGRVVTSSANAIAGKSLNTNLVGHAHSSALASMMRNYGAHARYNTVSPPINVPTPCATGTTQLLFNAYMNTADPTFDFLWESSEDGNDTTAQLKLYISTNDGVTWQPAVWTQTATGAAQTFRDVAVDLGAYEGQQIRLRFEWTSQRAANQSAGTVIQAFTGGCPAFGCYVDNLRFRSTLTEGFWSTE